MQVTIFIPSRAGLVAVDIEEGGLISGRYCSMECVE